MPLILLKNSYIRLENHPYLAEQNYTHDSINHSLGFVDPNDNTIHTNSIELRWSHLRKHVKRNVRLENIILYLNKFLFFFHTNERERYTILVNLIKNNNILI